MPTLHQANLTLIQPFAFCSNSSKVPVVEDTSRTPPTSVPAVSFHNPYKDFKSEHLILTYLLTYSHRSIDSCLPPSIYELRARQPTARIPPASNSVGAHSLSSDYNTPTALQNTAPLLSVVTPSSLYTPLRKTRLTYVLGHFRGHQIYWSWRRFLVRWLGPGIGLSFRRLRLSIS